MVWKNGNGIPLWHIRQRYSKLSHICDLHLCIVGAGLLFGWLIGHLYHQRNQVVLIEHLHTSGFQPTRKPLKTSYGYKLVLHDFSDLVEKQSMTVNSLPTAFTNSQTSISMMKADTTHTLRGSSSSASSGGSSNEQPRFFKGSGKQTSLMYSNSNITSLTAADKQRISLTLSKRAADLPGDSVHALMTGNGSPYQNIQGRIMYATLQLVALQPGGDHIKAFTRIMHRTADDDLVGELPTFRAYPLQPSCDTWCEFPVKDRANAVVQWLMAAAQNPDMIQGAWLLLLESDYAWMKPLELPGSAHDTAVQGYGFRYDYIDPQFPTAAKVIKEMCPECDVNQVPHSGPAPVLLRPHQLALVAPDWEAYTAWIEGNQHARDTLGWVREMYAWCVAVHRNGVQLTHEAPPKSKLLSQPPHDQTIGEAAMLHYTWGTLYHKDGKEIWRFDKRDWTAKEHELKVPTFSLPPQPWQEGWKLQDGVPVSKDLHHTVMAMLMQMNKASAGLPVIQAAA